MPELAGGGWIIGTITVGVNAVGDCATSRVAVTVGGIVTVGVPVVNKSQAGPAIDPLATSGPFAPTGTVPLVKERKQNWSAFLYDKNGCQDSPNKSCT